jgi:hypothetical protein
MYEPPVPPYDTPQPQQSPLQQVGAPLPAAEPIQNFAMGPQGPELSPPLGLNQTRHSAPHEADAQLFLTLNQPEHAIHETITPTSPLRSTLLDRLCKICRELDTDTLFLPCGHLAVCEHCAAQLNSCPICRHPIRSTVRVYRA